MAKVSSLSGAESKPALKRRVKLLLRVAISLALLTLVFSQIDSETLLRQIRLVSIETFILVSFLYAVSQIMSTFKWRILVQNVGISRTIPEFLRAYFLGMFVNTFGLGTVGGDVARALALRPEKGERAGALASVVADRVHGLSVLLSIGALAILAVKPPVLGDYAVWGSLAVVLGFCLFWLIGPRALVRLFPEHHRFGSVAAQTANAFPPLGPSLYRATSISACFHLLQIFLLFIIADEIGAPVTFPYLIATIPIVNAVATLPISIQGVGVREGLFILLLSPVGVTEEMAVTIGAVWLIVSTAVSAIGGLFTTHGVVVSSERNEPSEVKEIDFETARKNRQRGI